MKTLTNLPRLITTAIFGALALSCDAASIAADNSDVPQTVVKFGDLNLSNPQGAATLYSRIVAAAHEVCRSFDIIDCLINNAMISAKKGATPIGAHTHAASAANAPRCASC